MREKIHSIDKNIIDFIYYKLKNPVLDRVMPFITHLGDGGLIWIIISALLIFKPQYRNLGVLCLMSLALSVLLTEGIIKNIVERVRPIIRYPRENPLVTIPKSYSFPSGHTSSSFAIATVLFITFPYLKLASLLLAFMIGFSRIYLYVHYPTDVFVGMIIGVLSAVIVLITYKNILIY
ncbi:phosphatase PAP2 family protein [Clostridium senegalense]|uniref:phosphatase PAP2 family protein n=1 Tax=Clostridium senegalense TaxID=1465809 RepID=UPI000288006F|nr:phosphatase PAP2 family protein [Clostridium senegalense]MBU5226756.1 phosphatase PAP2 family protein [Clostridium senegalense]